jgi:NADPH:quinone reductase-like Zn-dependent oxidoreductase
MRAVRLHPEGLVVEEVKAPRPGAGEALVPVHAAAITRDELARVVSVAEDAEGARYFVVEPSRAQLVELARLADAGELEPAINSVFLLEDAGAAFARVAERGKRGKVVLRSRTTEQKVMSRRS